MQAIRKIFLLVLIVDIVMSACAQYNDKEIKKLDSLSRKLNNEGVDYAMAGNLDMASKLFLQSLKIIEKIPGYNKLDLASGYINLANAKQEIGYADSALFYYEVASSYFDQVMNPNKTLLATLYVEMGDCNLLFNDFQNSITLIKKGISLYEADSVIDYYNLMLGYLKLGIAYNTMGKYHEAIQMYNISLKIARDHRPEMIKSIFINLGNAYSKMGDYPQAINYFIESERLFLKYGINYGKAKIYRLYSNIGYTYYQINDYQKALKYYQLALDNYHEFNFDNGPFISRLYNQFGNVYLSIDSLKTALDYFTKSLKSNNYGGSFENVFNLSTQKLYSFPNAQISFEGLGDIFVRKCKVEYKEEYAAKALRAYNLAIAKVEDMRYDIGNEDDKLIVSEKYHTIYQKALIAAVNFSYHDKGYLNEAFKLSSKSKATILHEMINRFKNGEFAGVPNEVLKKEKELKTRLNGLSEMLYEEYRKSTPEKSTIKKFEDLIFETQKANNDLITRIKSSYPNYYSLKFDTSSVSIDQIQRTITLDRVLVEYIKTDSAIYSFAITADTVLFNQLRINKEFNDNLSSIKKELIPNRVDNLTLDDVKAFASSSNYLYNNLLAPFEPLFSGKRIVIIPSGELNSLPFNTLIRYIPDNIRGYYDLPYLILTNPISISLSSKLFVEQANAPKLFNISTLSIAPEYNYIDTSQSSDGRIYRQNLIELPGAKSESENIVKLFGGKILSGQSVSENEFKQIAYRYNIMHLAMHTYINNDNPNYSKLIFGPTKDSADDGYLNAYEIYNLNFNCRLAILSACRSADGASVGGEGIISIARGFNYSGCPSLIATLWKVDDESGADLVKSFAKHLKKGLSLSDAMQKAQVDFIMNADPLRSHPYFWAAYQVYGSDNPVMYSSTFKWMIYLGAIILLGVAVYPLIFKKKKIHHRLHRISQIFMNE